VNSLAFDRLFQQETALMIVKGIESAPYLL
jgi:hypothetical protein